MIQPLVFGYLLAQISSRPESSPSDRRAITDFATREGFALSQIFVESRHAPSRVALASLIEAAQFHTIAAVVIPDVTHLGIDTVGQAAIRRRIETAVEAPVLTVHIENPGAALPSANGLP